MPGDRRPGDRAVGTAVCLTKHGTDTGVARQATRELVDLVGGLTLPHHTRDDLDSLTESLTWLGWWLKKHGHRRDGRAATQAAATLRGQIAATRR